MSISTSAIPAKKERGKGELLRSSSLSLRGRKEKNEEAHGSGSSDQPASKQGKGSYRLNEGSMTPAINSGKRKEFSCLIPGRERKNNR